MKSPASMPTFEQFISGSKLPLSNSDPSFDYIRKELLLDLRAQRYKLVPKSFGGYDAGLKIARNRFAAENADTLSEVGSDLGALEKEVQQIESRATSSLYMCVLIALASSFLWGYHTAVMSPAERSTLPHHTPVNWSVVVTAMVFGAIFGSMMGGPMTKKIGGRRAIILTCLANLAGGLSISFTGDSVGIAILARMIVGFAAGLTMCAVPLYIGEVAPPQMRGTLNGFPQLMNCGGVLTAQLLGLAGWKAPYLYGTAVIIAGAQLFAAIVFPLAQTPECTVVREIKRSGGVVRCKKRDEAMAVCQRLYGYDEIESLAHVQVIERAVSSSSLTDVAASGGLFSDRAYSTMTLSVIVMNLCQQLSGFNAILQYSAIFFRPFFSNPGVATVLVGVANLVGSVSTTAVMDSTPRKRLLAVSLGGMFLSTIVVAMASGIFVVIAVGVFALCFQIGLGPLPGCMASEMYGADRKKSAQGLAVMMNNLANFLVTLAFPVVYDAVQAFTFVAFGVVLAFAFVFTLLVIPETLNKTPSQVHASLTGNGAYEPLPSC